MKLLFILFTIAGLLLLPMAGFSTMSYSSAALGSAEQNTTPVNPPPVAQSLVREGSFAVKLAEALHIGAPQNEAAAESTLASIGIAPKNGWIADYPVTPQVIDQLQNSIQDEVNSGKLAMSTAAAMAALQSVSEDFNLNIVAAGPSGNQTAGEPAPGSSRYTSPAVVNNYYYDYGPPVITYYTPPPPYFYLYAWVPSPFWGAGFYFPGFFILNDFDTVIVVHHRREICTNHVFRPGINGFFIINPVNGRFYRSVREFPHYNRFAAEKGGQREGVRPPVYSERSHRSPSSTRSHGRMENFGNREFFGGLPGGYSEEIQRGGRGHEDFNRGFDDRHFAGIPQGGVGHEGFDGRFHSRHFEGIHRGAERDEDFGRGFHQNSGFRRG